MQKLISGYVKRESPSKRSADDMVGGRYDSLLSSLFPYQNGNICIQKSRILFLCSMMSHLFYSQIGSGLKRPHRDSFKERGGGTLKKARLHPSGPKSTPALSSQSSSELYPVDHIVDYRFRAGQHEYLVKWRGYSEKDNTWEPAEHITDDLINDFQTRKGSQH